MERNTLSRIINSYGIVNNTVEGPRRSPNEYSIIGINGMNLAPADAIVRQVENAFAKDYDAEEFAGNPTMQFMAESDRQLLERWTGGEKQLQGKRILVIGPGTGRDLLPLAAAVGDSGKVYGVDIAEAYYGVIAQKAALAGIPPERMKFGVGDMQQLSPEQLLAFMDGQQVDMVVAWFGPLALMTTNPQGVVETCYKVLAPQGEMLITTNARYGLGYTVPERFALEEKAIPYRPGIYTRRQFGEGKDDPSGMILGNGLVLPANFYSPDTARALFENAGFRVKGMQGIVRLTAIFPRDLNETDALSNYVRFISEIEPEAAQEMEAVNGDPTKIWKIASSWDLRNARNPQRLPQYNYLGVRAVKSKRRIT